MRWDLYSLHITRLPWYTTGEMTDPGPRRIAAIYAAFGFLWIGLSDTMVGRVATSPRDLARLQTYKGWVFVGLTTVLVYILSRLYSRYRNRAEQDLVRANEEIAAALREKEILVRELRHRVMNNLQSVTALLNLTSDVESPAASRERIYALSTCHEVALACDDLSRIEPLVFLTRLREVLVSRDSGCTQPITIVSPPSEPFFLTINHAIPVGMFLFELCREEYPNPQEATFTLHFEAESPSMVLAASRSVEGISAALCDAWGAQAGGIVTHRSDGTVLRVPLDGKPTRSWR